MTKVYVVTETRNESGYGYDGYDEYPVDTKYVTISRDFTTAEGAATYISDCAKEKHNRYTVYEIEIITVD